MENGKTQEFRKQAWKTWNKFSAFATAKIYVPTFEIPFCSVVEMILLLLKIVSVIFLQPHDLNFILLCCLSSTTGSRFFASSTARMDSFAITERFWDLCI